MKFFLLLLLCNLSWAGPWVSNKDHSEVMFEVPYMGVSELTGRFTQHEASFESSGEDLQSIRVKIDTSSIDTGNKMRDGHLKDGDFFDASTYPEMVFIGKTVTRVQKGSYKVAGALTIKKITRPVVIDFSITDSVKDTWGYENRFVKFKASLSRKDYGITWNKTLDEQKYLVGDEVKFWGVFQMQPQSAKTPPSKHMIPDTNYIREREQKARKEEPEASLSRKLRKLINGQ